MAQDVLITPASTKIAFTDSGDTTTVLRTSSGRFEFKDSGESNFVDIYANDIVLDGNLTVGGTTTTVNTSNILIEDPILQLAKGQTSGSPTVDIGFVGLRGDSNNAAFIWDESADQFAAILTTGDGSSTTLTPASYAGLKAGASFFTGGITVENSLLRITSAAPNLIFSVPSGGLDSRIFNDGSGNFIIGHGDNSDTPTERLRINSSGNVTFSSIVTVNGASSVGNSKLVVAGVAQTGVISDVMSVTVPNTAGNRGGYAVRNSAGGIVGSITGEVVTAGAYPNNVGKIDINVQNGGSSLKGLSIANTGAVTANYGLTVGPSNNSKIYMGGNDYIAFTDGVGDGFKFVYDNSERLRITNVGRVGIGTTSPDGQLEISRNQTTEAFTTPFIKLKPSNTTNSTGLTSITFGTSTVDDYGYSISGWRAGTDGSPHLKIMRHSNSATGVDVMAMDAAGNVGIGTASPAADLEVSTASGGELVVDNYGSSGVMLQQRNGGATNSGSFKLSGGTLINFFTNDTEKVRIDSNGNVGIGTTSPSYKLHISANSTTLARFDGGTQNNWVSINSNTGKSAGIVYADNGSDKWYVGHYNGNADGFSFYDASTSAVKVFIKEGGNVGIGTTAPEFKLQVENTVAAGSDNFILNVRNPTHAADSRAGIAFRMNNNTGSNWDGAGIQATNDGVTGAGHLTFGGVEDSTFTERVRIQVDGKVGIGTASPDSKLEIAGGGYNSSLKIKGSGADTGIQFEDSAGNTDGYIYANGGMVGFLDAGTHWTIQCKDDDYIKFLTNNGTERMRITSAGNVGIGTSSPGAKLHIQSDGSHDEGAEIVLKHSNNNTTDIVSTISFQNNGGQVAKIESGTTGANNTGYISFFTENAGTISEKLRVLGDGNIGIGRTTAHGKLDIAAADLGSSSGDVSVVSRSTSDVGSNSMYLLEEYVRTSAGSDWTTSGVRLQAKTDSTYQGYIQFNGDGNNYGITFGAGAGGTSSPGTTPEKMRINSTGNVSIGSTSSGYGRLFVDAATTAANTALAVRGRDASADYLALNVMNNSDSGLFAIYNSGKAYVSGQLGIGTTSPNDDLNIHDSSASANLGIKITRGTQTHGLRIGVNDSHAFVWTDQSQNLAFATNNTERLTILSGGSVGIGTTSPSSRLHINSFGSDFSLRLSSTASRAGIVIDHPSTTSIMGSALVLASDDTYRLGTASYYHVVMNQAGRTQLFGGGSVGLTVNTNQTVTIGAFTFPTADGTANQVLQTDGSGTLSWSSAGTGTISGSGTDNYIPRFNGTGALQDSSIIADDSGNITQIGGSPEYHFGTTSASHRNWRIAAQEVVDQGFEIASGTASAGSSAASDTYTTRFVIKGDTGYVGIGTTAPLKDVDVKYSSNNSADIAGSGLAGANAGNGILINNTATNVASYANLDFRANNADGRIAFRYDAANKGSFHFITDNDGGGLVNGMSIRSDGNVGIGKDGAAEKLHVDGAGYFEGGGVRDGGWHRGLEITTENNNFSSLYFGSQSTTKYSGIIWTSSNSGNTPASRGAQIYAQPTSATNTDIRFDTNNAVGSSSPTLKMIVRGDGKVGIGTAGPTRALHVVGGVYVPSGASGFGTGDTTALVNILGTGANNATSALRVFRQGGDELLRTYNDGMVTMGMISTANIGIGTATPEAKLTVAGSTAHQAIFRTAQTTASERAGGGFSSLGHGTATSRYARLFLDADGANFSGTDYFTIEKFGNSGEVKFLQYSNANMSFWVNTSTQAMTIKNDGKVGIGTTSPSTKLHIAGGSEGSQGGLRIDHPENSTSVTSGYYQLYVYNTDTTNGNHAAIYFGDGSGGASSILSSKINDHSNNYGDMQFWTRGSGGSGIRLHIDQEGSVGIGTTSPSYPLQVEYAGGAAIGMQVKGTSNRAKLVVTDNDTSTYLIAEDSMASVGRSDGLSTNNLTINGTGCVGIGVTNPSQKLDVRGGNIYIESGYKITWSNGDAEIIEGRTSNYSLALRTYDGSSAMVTNMFLKSGGDVGIGTESPAYKLDISTANDSGIRLRNGAGSANNGVSFNVGSGTPWMDITEGKEFRIKGNTYANLGTWNSGSNTKFMIDASGVVLVGATTSSGNAAQKFQVGTVLAGSSSAVAQINGLVRITNMITHASGTGASAHSGAQPAQNNTGNLGNTDYRYYGVYSNIGNFSGNLTVSNQILTPSGENLALNPNSGLVTVGGALQTTGNVTVGGTLTVAGSTTTIDTTNLLVEDPLIVLAKNQTGTPALDAGLIIERGDYSNAGLIYDESADEFAFMFTDETGSTAGNVTIASYAALRVGSITESSSIAIKENIFDFTSPLEKISKVRPVKYNRKTSKDKKEIGLIAEELAEIFPELVENDKDGNPTSVNYTRAVTVLFDGFKQMYKELKEIKEKIK